jgi:hypothetical protein
MSVAEMAVKPVPQDQAAVDQADQAVRVGMAGVMTAAQFPAEAPMRAERPKLKERSANWLR